MRFRSPVLFAAAALIFLAGTPAGIGVAADKKAAPPTAKELVGVWVGFDSDELTFTRLTFALTRPDSALAYLPLTQSARPRCSPLSSDEMERERLEHRNPHDPGVERHSRGLRKRSHWAGFDEVNDWWFRKRRMEGGAVLASGVSDSDFKSRDEKRNRKSRAVKSTRIEACAITALEMVESAPRQIL